MIVAYPEETMEASEAAGVEFADPVAGARPGVTIGVVEDPDGSWVEFDRSS